MRNRGALADGDLRPPGASRGIGPSRRRRRTRERECCKPVVPVCVRHALGSRRASAIMMPTQRARMVTQVQIPKITDGAARRARWRRMARLRRRRRRSRMDRIRRTVRIAGQFEVQCRGSGCHADAGIGAIFDARCKSLRDALDSELDREGPRSTASSGELNGLLAGTQADERQRGIGRVTTYAQYVHRTLRGWLRGRAARRLRPL